MKRFLRVFLCALLLGALAQPSHADSTLVTARLTSTTGDFGHCGIVNAGTKPIVVSIQAVRFDGAVIAQAADVAIDPDHSTGISLPTGFATFHCRFTGSFSKSKVRANGVVVSGGRTIVSVSAQ